MGTIRQPQTDIGQENLVFASGKTLTITDMTAGSVIFAGTAGVLSQDNSNLFWDNTNKRQGIATTSPVAKLDVNGGVALDVITTTSATYNATIANFTILCNATSNAITVNLPAVATSTGLVLNIKKTDSTVNTVTIDGNASETIDGDTTVTITSPRTNYCIQCDGSAWYVI